MEWKDIKEFLTRATSIVGSEKVVRTDLAALIKDIVKADILERDIVLRDGVVMLAAHPLIKGEVFLHKDKILEQLRTRNPRAHVRDIR